MELLSIMYLSYIYLAHGLYYTNLVYSKGTYVILEVNMYKTYNLLHPFIAHDHVIVTVTISCNCHIKL